MNGRGRKAKPAILDVLEKRGIPVTHALQLADDRESVVRTAQLQQREHPDLEHPVIFRDAPDPCQGIVW